jgi:hypothetical protein
MTWRSALGIAALLVACGGDDGGPADGTVADDSATSGAATGGTGPDPTAATGATEDTSDETGGSALRPNWHEDIAPFVAEHCRGCHDAGGIAFSMATYASTLPWAPLMVTQTEARLMPPWHGVETDECTPPHAFKHDPRLTDEQIQMLADWVDLQSPEGDPALASPIPPPPSLDLANPTVDIPMGGSVSVEAQGSALDFFHCLSFDPGNTEDVYVDAMQIVPGNPVIAHHTLLFIDTDADSASWPGGISENCGGGSGVSGGQLVGGWVPGALPIETPDDVGILLPAGARIIFNMHYHASVVGPEVDDATRLILRWQDTAPSYVSQFTLVGAPGAGTITQPPFSIPAGESDHQEVVEYTVPPIGLADVRVWSIVNHMHKVGVDMKTSVLRGGNEECLVQTPGWDFEWQRMYAYDVPIDQSFKVQSGDVVRVRCTYDNTLDNAALVEALGEVGLDQPQTVQLGEGTLDEMCLAGVGVAVRVP